MNKNILKPKMMASGIRVAVVIAVFFGALVLTSCGGGGGSSSSPAPVTPNCEKNNTADVMFGNRSTTGITLYVKLDGLHIVNIAPGDTSLHYTVSAGVPHVLEFLNVANGATACTISYPNFAQCSSHTITCSR